MSPSAQVKSWQERKSQLLLESEINRRVLTLEWSQLKSSLNWTQSVMRKLQSPSPAWLLLAPIAGFLLAKRFRTQKGWLGQVFFLWRIGRRILSIVQGLKGARAATF
jgi:hypothetical protein